MATGRGRRVGSRSGGSRASTPDAGGSAAPSRGRGKRANQPAPKGTAPSNTARTAVTTITLGLVAVLVVLVLYAGAYLVRPHHGRGVAVRLTLPDSPTSESVSLALYRANIIDRPWLFSAWLTITGTIDDVRPGMIP